MSLIGPEGRNQLKAFGLVATAGIELGAAVAIGWFGFGWIAERLETGTWLPWVGLALGLGAGFYNFFRIARFARKQLEASDSTDAEDDADGN